MTYYSWRKKGGLTRKRGRRGATARAARSADLSSQVRGEVQAKMRQIIPDIVRSEVSAYLDAIFRTPRRRRRRT